MCKSYLQLSIDASEREEELMRKVEERYVKVHIYKEILALDERGWPSWQTLAIDCDSQPSNVIRKVSFIDIKRFVAM